MLTTKKEIKEWLDSVDVENYTINNDLTVDVKGDVSINNLQLTSIPVQFATVDGDFWCDSNQLTSLKGAPYEVNGTFHCAMNKLTSLEHAPKIVDHYFNCKINRIATLVGFDSKIGRKFFHGVSTKDAYKIKELVGHYKKDTTGIEDCLVVEISGSDLRKILDYEKLQAQIANKEGKKDRKVKI